MRINTNVSAFTAYRNLTSNDTTLSKSLERLSSGLRINRGQDDPTGMMISQGLRLQISGLSQAEKNNQEGLALTTAADNILDAFGSILQRGLELKLSHQNATDNDVKTALAQEWTDLTEALEELANTKYQGTALFTGSERAITIQAGTQSSDTVTITLPTLDGTTTPTIGGQTVSETLGSATATSFENAIKELGLQRAKIGSMANVFELKVGSLQTLREGMISADSRIRDTDVALETSALTRSQILVQSATAMLAQANARPLSALALLR